MSYSSWKGIHAKEFDYDDAASDKISLASTISLDAVPYDSGNRLVALSGLVFSLIAGLVFFTIGVVIYVISPSYYEKELAKGLMPLLPDTYTPQTDRIAIIPLSSAANIAIELSMSALATACTEATGYVHGTTLKWGLAREGRLAFNANLRFFSATKGAFSPNGPVVSALFGISIILAYASSSVFLLRATMMDRHGQFPEWTTISFLPLIVFGTMIILQAALGLNAFYATPVHTWSSNPLDVTSALVYHGYICRRPKRCMRPVSMTHDPSTDPIRPSPRQPSPWASHKSVARVVYLSWFAAALWFVLGGVVVVSANTWAEITWYGVAPPVRVLQGLFLMAAIQSILTIVLHCCELVTTLSRDEAVWRAASTMKGARPAGNPLKMAMGSWQNVGLLAAKPLIHWFFGQAVRMEPLRGFFTFIQGTFLVAGGMVVLAAFITIVAKHRPPGPQPAAYGHIQTLADLVDDWSATMYWGHKGNGWAVGAIPVRRAGTTNDDPLPPVCMNSAYA
ncbi:hypothetical protein FRB98_001846 [Tulasnella sp. 332]|nr:hypothetical protein FRB98_001846 [Tulasnella sp. 332]